MVTFFQQNVFFKLTDFLCPFQIPCEFVFKIKENMSCQQAHYLIALLLLYLYVTYIKGNKAYDDVIMTPCVIMTHDTLCSVYYVFMPMWCQ